MSCRSGSTEGVSDFGSSGLTNARKSEPAPISIPVIQIADHRQDKKDLPSFCGRLRSGSVMWDAAAGSTNLGPGLHANFHASCSNDALETHVYETGESSGPMTAGTVQ